MSFAAFIANHFQKQQKNCKKVNEKIYLQKQYIILSGILFYHQLKITLKKKI